MAEDLDIQRFYRLTRKDNHNSIIVKRDASPPTLVSVGGRWSVIDRPRQQSFTVWNGDDLYRMDLPILFDGWDDLDSVEDQVAILNNMRLSKETFQPPPQIDIDGAVPVKGATWVIESIDFGQNVIWHEDGYRLRQDAVVHLLQYVEAETLKITPPATAHTYRVKAGDTLKSISKSQYGTSKYWSAIKNANNIRDIKKLPKTLKIPALVSPSG